MQMKHPASFTCFSKVSLPSDNRKQSSNLFCLPHIVVISHALPPAAMASLSTMLSRPAPARVSAARPSSRTSRLVVKAADGSRQGEEQALCFATYLPQATTWKLLVHSQIWPIWALLALSAGLKCILSFLVAIWWRRGCCIALAILALYTLIQRTNSFGARFCLP